MESYYPTYTFGIPSRDNQPWESGAGGAVRFVYESTWPANQAVQGARIGLLFAPRIT